jgi:peptide/nickel transport system permease protein
MAATTPLPAAGAGPSIPVAPRGGSLRRVVGAIRDARGISRALLWIGFAIVALFIVLAVFAPLIAPYTFDAYRSHGTDFARQGHPGNGHLFGTTVQGFDVLSRVVFGARTALEVVVLAVVFSVALGVPLGLVSGYLGGWLDRVLVLIMDALFAFPYLLLAIVIAFLLSSSVGSGVLTAAIAITAVYVPQYFRVVRNSTISAREATYVESARALGAKPRTVMTRYLFANVIQSVPVIATLNAADAILTLAALGFLGYGIQPTEAAEWGYDLQRAIADASAGIWWTGLYPGLAIVLLVTGLTLVGEGLNDVINPTLRRRASRAVDVPESPDSAQS